MTAQLKAGMILLQRDPADIAERCNGPRATSFVKGKEVNVVRADNGNVITSDGSYTLYPDRFGIDYTCFYTIKEPTVTKPTLMQNFRVKVRNKTELAVAVNVMSALGYPIYELTTKAVERGEPLGQYEAVGCGTDAEVCRYASFEATSSYYNGFMNLEDFLHEHFNQGERKRARELADKRAQLVKAQQQVATLTREIAALEGK